MRTLHNAYKAHGVQFVRVSMTSDDTDDGSFFGVIAVVG